jgi:tRNA-(ms[2]io[6]A)-hydroxylase
MSSAIELAWCTPPEWAERALLEPAALLSDHAHCELRAASKAQTLITRNATQPRLVDALAALAAEEMRHFRRVVACLRALGGELEPAHRNPYVAELLRRSGPTRGEALLDELLLAGLVEARSLERFELLAQAAEQPRLRALYGELAPSEAAHAGLFLDLAHVQSSEGRVGTRLAELIAIEAEVAAGLPFAPRVHSGLR